ncbi:MAG TPA: hypothetical protein VNL15_06185 [Dehalococcoidia bacterium]|nr:hypothetical protein [Dehalococcoidia bacterium]
MTTQQECIKRQEQGLPANALTVWPDTNGARLNLTTPKGSINLRLSADGMMLETYSGKPLDLNRLVMDDLNAAIAEAHPEIVEYKHGWEIEDGDRDGWEYIGDAGAEDEHAANLYRRVVTPGSGPIIIWFRREDMTPR